MKPYEFKKVYHPQLGRYVYKHKEKGLIVDSILKPFRKVVTSVLGKVVKPMAKKALKSGIEHAGDKIGKKVVEKSGDFIMKKLHKGFSKRKSSAPTVSSRNSAPKGILKNSRKESTHEYINRILSSN